MKKIILEYVIKLSKMKTFVFGAGYSDRHGTQYNIYFGNHGYKYVQYFCWNLQFRIS